jgi:hypothetical protein
LSRPTAVAAASKPRDIGRAGVHAMIAAPMLHRRIADNSAIRRAHE